MKVFVKEALYVLDYNNKIVDTLFLSDDSMTPGYAYNITVEESNTGYSNLTFTMPTKILGDNRVIGDIKDNAGLIDNPKLKKLTPLVKLRYRRQVFYTGTEPIKVQEPVGYGDALVFTTKTYSADYPNNIIEDYVMDYIVQPTQHKRSGVEVSVTYNAIDYPRFNLSKKKMGLTINDDTTTKGIWSLYKSEPMSIPGTVQYIRWTEDMTEKYGNGIDIPTEWDPSTATEFPMHSEQIYDMMSVKEEWPYGLTATVFWWPITGTGRFEGIIYNEGDYLTLNVYPKFETGEVDVSEITYSLDFYGYTWNYLDRGDSYLTPNNPCNYLNWTLETTNWSVATRNDKQFVGTYFDKTSFPKVASKDQYLLYQIIKEDSNYIGQYNNIDELPSLTEENMGDWAVISNDEGTIQYRWDGEDWYKEEYGLSKIETAVYTGTKDGIVWDGNFTAEDLIPLDDNVALYKVTDKFYRYDSFIDSQVTFSRSDGSIVGTYTITEDTVGYLDYPDSDALAFVETENGELLTLLSFKDISPELNGTYLMIAYSEEINDFVWVSSILFAGQNENDEVWVDATNEIWTASIDKSTGVLYDVDQVETEIAKPDLSVGDLFETVALQCSLGASDSNCYNLITEIAKQFQLYPVFDCEKRTVALKLFVGKNYGLTYRLGYSLENTGVKRDGDKVITKLHCFGGQDNQSNEVINLGEAERSYKLYNAGVYKSWAALPEKTDAVWAVAGDMPTENYWEYDPEKGTRNVYKYDAEDGLWVMVRPTVDDDGTIHHYVETDDGIFDIDLETGMPLPWDPNDPAYIQSRSPYGTEYMYNFKWMYENDWMTKGQILALYTENNKIQELNKKFLEPYTEDFLNTNDAYVDAGVNYSTNQDEFLACINSMMNSYYRHPGKTTEKFQAFPEAPAGCRLGKEGTAENPKGYYLDTYYCSKCHHIEMSSFTTCPKCNEEGESVLYTIHVNTWTEEQASPEGTTSEQWNPSSKGHYQNLYNTFEGETHLFYLGKKFKTEPIDDLTEVPSTKTNETKFYIENKVKDEEGNVVEDEFYDKSSGLYNWNDYVDKWKEYLGYALKNLEDVRYYENRLEMLEQEFKNYQHDLEILEDGIQDKWGDYIIEGKFSDTQIVYPAILLAKSLEASEKYSVPEITYSLNVVDSSGLIEYRRPCADTYNELVRMLHNKGQIVPRAGDYVRIYDEQLGLKGHPGLITNIKRTLDKPQSNSITLDTAYTDADDLVGNIITATNTVLNNTDIYARTAVLKADGSIDGAALTKTLETNSGENIAFVGVKGSTLLDSTGLLVSNPTDPNRKMKYTGSGIYGTIDNGASYDMMVGPNGINANYISSGQIDTKAIQIISGQKAKVKLDNLGLSVIDNTSKAYYLPSKPENGTFRDWSNSNLKAFIGVDNNNEALLYLNGQMVVEEGSRIAGWNVLEDKLYSGSGNFYVGLGTSGDYRIWAGNEDPTKAPFSVKKDGTLKATSATIDGVLTAKADSKIGPWNISSSSIWYGSNNFYNSGSLYFGTSGISIKNKFKVDSNGYLTCSNANLTNASVSGSISASSLTLTGNATLDAAKVSGTLTAATISGGNISGGTITAADIHLNSGTVKLCTTGRVEFSNKTGFFSMGPKSTHSDAAEVTHPYVSGLNVAKGSGGISFRDSGGIEGSGSQRGYVLINSDSFRGATNQLNIFGDDGVEIASNAWIYLWSKIELQGKGGNVWAGNDDISQGKVKTTTGDASSRILKKNFEEFSNKEYEDAYNLLKKMKLYNYDYKYNMYTDKHQYGFIIDELEEYEETKQFFRFEDMYAEVKGENLNPSIVDNPGFDINNLPKNCIAYKEYNSDVLDKFLLTLCKSLQTKIEELQQEINILKKEKTN